MSASIMYERVKPGRSLGVDAPSSFLRAMREAFGEGNDWTLVGVESALVLRGMACADPSLADAYEKLRSALDSSPEGIRIWAEY